MTIEARVLTLESKCETLDFSLRELMKMLGATHEVVTMLLKEQLDMKKEMIESRRENKEQLNRIELLIRQSHSNH